MRWPRALFATWDASSPSRRRSIAVVAIAVAAVVLLFAVRPLSDGNRPRAIGRRAYAIRCSTSAQARIADSASLAQTPLPLRAGDLRAAVDRVMARHELPRGARSVGNERGALRPSSSTEARFDAVVAALDALGRDEAFTSWRPRSLRASSQAACART